MPILFRVGIKPTASIGKEQDTIDLSRQENAKLVVKGRHDPCIVPRRCLLWRPRPRLRRLIYCWKGDLYDIRRSTPPDRRHRQPAGSFILPADGLLPGGRQDQGERESSHFQRPAGGGNSELGWPRRPENMETQPECCTPPLCRPAAPSARSLTLWKGTSPPDSNRRQAYTSEKTGCGLSRRGWQLFPSGGHAALPWQ